VHPAFNAAHFTLEVIRMDAPELLWRQYALSVDLYKFYMDLVVKFNVFYYAVTGAILSFFLLTLIFKMRSMRFCCQSS
jgi:hypothetical protein